MFNRNRDEPQPLPRGFNPHEVTMPDEVAEEAAEADEPVSQDPQP